MTLLLGIALFGPAALLALDRRRARLGALVLAAAWLVVLLADRDATLGRFGAGTAEIGVGTWLLVASIRWPSDRRTVALTSAAAALAVGGVALPAIADAVGGLALAAAVLVVAARTEADGGLPAAAGATAGVALLALADVRGSELLLLAGAAVGVVAAAARVRRAGVVLLPAVLAVGTVAPLTHRWTAAVLLALAATALAGRPATALGLWTLAGGTLSADPLLLGASAVITGAMLHPVAAVTAVPGVAHLVGRADGIDSGWLFVLAVLGAITVLRLWRRPEDTVPGPPSTVTAVALAIGAWLLLAPETWLDTAALTSWGTGVAIAGGVAVLGAFVVASFTDAAFVVPDLEVGDPPHPPRDPSWAWPAALGGLVVLAVAGGALVASTVS